MSTYYKNLSMTEVGSLVGNGGKLVETGSGTAVGRSVLATCALLAG